VVYLGAKSRGSGKAISMISLNYISIINYNYCKSAWVLNRLLIPENKEILH